MRLISESGEQLGVVSIEVAIEKAKDVGLDLIEVAPGSKPPVCRILDYGKLRYEEKKRQQLSKKKQHIIKIKEIRLRPQIDDHDLSTNLKKYTVASVRPEFVDPSILYVELNSDIYYSSTKTKLLPAEIAALSG